MNNLHRLLSLASASFFYASIALAQNAGTVTNHALPIGKGVGVQGYGSLLLGNTQIPIGQTGADPQAKTVSGDATLAATGALTLATVNSNVGSFGSATQCASFTTNGKGLITAASATTCTPAIASVTGLGTGVATALGVNVGTAGAFVVNGGALGTPSSGTLTNATGLPIGSGVSGLGAGCATFLGTPSSANLRGCLTDEVGTGAAYFVGGALGTPASATLTNATGLPLTGLTAQGAYTFVGNNTGASAIPTAVDIAALTTKASPAASDYVMLSDQAASGAWKKATVGTLGAGTPANPTASVGLSAVNGVATTYMRSDAAPSLDQSISPTWTGTHTFNNSTYSALFSGGPVGINNATPTATLHVGGVAAASSGANILSARNSTGATSVHGFAENSTINLSAAGQGMDSYDARMVVSGTQTYDHFVSYQSRPIYGSTGAATNGYGFWDQITANGPITTTTSYYASNPVGTGTITNAYGFYAEAITKGSTLNYAFFSAGTTPSKFGGNVDVGGLSLAGSDQFGAWTAYTPSVSAQTNGGTMTTSSSGRYKQIGKTVCVSIQAGTSALGTATGYLILGLPVAAKQTSTPAIAFSGVKSGLLSINGIIDTTTTIDVSKYDGTSPLTAGHSYYITGCYEAS